MKKALQAGTKTFLAGLVFVLVFTLGAFAQKTKPTPKPAAGGNLPKVTQIDEISIKTALKPNGKPLLVNFWATWCDPCREEFPDLVKIDAEYKGKIDFVTVSLDDLAEINRDVPKFLSSMKAEMPAYLLKTADENAVINSITKDWEGGLPFTILYNEKGEIAYFRQGKIKIPEMKAELDKLLFKPSENTTALLDLSKIKLPSTAEGVADAKNDIAKGILKIQRYGLTPAVSAESLQNYKIKYGIEIIENGCLAYPSAEYFKAYNETMRAEIAKRFGASAPALPF